MDTQEKHPSSRAACQVQSLHGVICNWSSVRNKLLFVISAFVCCVLLLWALLVWWWSEARAVPCK